MPILKPEFEKLESVYTAIKDLDRVMDGKSGNKEDMFDNAINAIKSIDKRSLDTDIIKEKVITGIREALVKMYMESAEKINSGIGLGTSFENTEGVNTVYRGVAIESGVRYSSNSELLPYKEIDEVLSAGEIPQYEVKDMRNEEGQVIMNARDE